VFQAWQFVAVTLGQMPLGGTDMFFDQVEVVEQTILPPALSAACHDGCRQQFANAGQCDFVADRRASSGPACAAQQVGACRQHPPYCSIWSALKTLPARAVLVARQRDRRLAENQFGSRSSNSRNILPVVNFKSNCFIDMTSGLACIALPATSFIPRLSP